jgi:hypothetical protein
MKTEEEIRFFLRMGYFPGYESWPKLDWSFINPTRYTDLSREDLITESARLWRETIGAQFQAGRRNVVPLSGGLDSRAILAVLREFTESANIETYTFGTPGTLDYDLGCRVARAAGTRHTAIRLDDFIWSQDDFGEAAARFDHQTMLFHHAPMKILDQFADGVIWSGYIGDLVTGGHFTAKDSGDLAVAKTDYLVKRRAVKSVDMAGSYDFSHLIGGEDVPDYLSAAERVMLAEVGKITAPHVLMSGFDYRVPFINSPFWGFFMSVPGRFRADQNLYREMLGIHWGKLFSLPVKSRQGVMMRARNRAWRIGRDYLKMFDWPVLPMTNYIDLDLLMRRDVGLREIVFSQIQDLKDRGAAAFVDIDGIWDSHMKRRGHHADALKILFSLEVNLKGLEAREVLGRAMAS